MNQEKKAELWDVYTKDREKTGCLHRRGEPMKPGDYHLVVHVCIFNSRNQLLIQQRQPFKKGFPNMWDLSVGGSAVAGDSSCMAAEREVYEELGLKLDLSHTRPRFTVNFPEGFDDYYIIYQDVNIESLHLQEEEVKQVRWASKDEVIEMQENGTMVPYWFADRLFEMRRIYGAHNDRLHDIEIAYASEGQLESWMNFIEIVRENFPGLETEEKIAAYRETLIRNIHRGSAICALDGKTVVGALLFSTKHNMLSFLAVHPEFRRRGIASKMLQEMLKKLDRSRDIVVETFRDGDEKGVAARALYQSFGFVPGELSAFENGYPLQQFVLKG